MVTCRRKNGRLQLHFSDNGMGMPDDVQQKIFEPFFSTKGAHGLVSVCQSATASSNVTPDRSALSLNRDGTDFTIELPAVAARQRLAILRQRRATHLS
jgi:signal transduction histidine kinase